MKIIALNLKAYSESSGVNLEKYAAACEENQNKNIQIILIPNVIDTTLATSLVRNTSIYVQISHAVPAGPYTSHVPVELLSKTGAKGLLLNHAEAKMPINEIKQLIREANKFKLETICCAKDDSEAANLAKLSPTYIAIEPPELIGSGISVSSAKPELVKRSIAAVSNVNSKVKVLIGAGISNSQDYKKSLELGADGVLLASAFVKSKNPPQWLAELLL